MYSHFNIIYVFQKRRSLYVIFIILERHGKKIQSRTRLVYLLKMISVQDDFKCFLTRLYESTGRAIAVTTVSASASASALALLKTLKVFG